MACISKASGMKNSEKPFTKSVNHELREIMVDSGASDHVVNDMTLFQTLNPAQNIKVELANCARVTTTVNRTVWIGVNGIPIILWTVHYIPTLKLIIISCNRFGEKAVTTNIANEQCSLFSWRDGNKFVGRIQKQDQDGLFVDQVVPPKRELTVKIIAVIIALNSISSRESLDRYSLWNRRMGHVSDGVIRKMISCGWYDMHLN